MSPRTRFISRILGFYSLFVSLAMVSHKHATAEMVMALIRDQPLLFVLGVMTVLAGLAMVLAHNIWSGGALPVIVNPCQQSLESLDRLRYVGFMTIATMTMAMVAVRR